MRRLLAVLALGAILAPVSAAADVILESVQIRCDLPRCQQTDEMRRLVSLTDLVVGKRYEPQMGDAAAWFLEQTELFEEGSVRVAETPTPSGGVEVIFETVGRTYIREVDIDIGLSLEEDIRQRLFMRAGVSFDPSRVESQIESIQAIFERDGYYDTQVQIISVEVEPYLVDLEVVVDRGVRLDVRDIYIRGHDAFSYDDLFSELVSAFGFIRTYTADAFDEGLDEIIEMYREAGYLRARIATSEAVPDTIDGTVDLYVEVREGPRWVFSFAGNRQFDDEDLMEVLPFAETGFIDDAELEASVYEIEALYRTAGHYFVSASVSQEWLDENEARVTYTIVEGPQAEVREINVNGNEHIPTAELLELMTTKEYGLIEGGGYLQPEQLEADILAIQDYYHERGFLSAFVPRSTVVAEDNGETLFITIFIEEGLQTLVSEVRFRGNQLLSDGALRRDLRLTPGDPLSISQLSFDEAAIRSRFIAIGHQPRKSEAVCYAGDVAMRCGRPQFPRGCEVFDPGMCTELRRGDRIVRECPRLSPAPGCVLGDGVTAPEVALEYRIAEGDLVTMGEVFIVGNFKTDDDVIRREMRLRTGSPYDPATLLEGQSNLRSLALFNSVRVQTIGVGSQSQYARDRAAIVVRVEEAATQFIEYRIGLVSETLAGNEFRVNVENQLGYINRNLAGRALGLDIIATFVFNMIGAARVQDGEFAASAAAIFSDPRFSWFTLADDPWEFRTGLVYYYDLLSGTLNVISYEWTTQFRQEFDAVEGLSFTLETSIKRAESKEPEQEEFDPPFVIIGLTPTLTLDRRDSPLNPTRGFRTDFSVDFADQFLGSGLDTVAYTKFELSGSYLVPLTRYFVLASYLRWGFTLGGIFSGFRREDSSSADPRDNRLLPSTEGFWLGGISGVRGYIDNSLGPSGPSQISTWGDFILNGSVELRFPVFPAADLYGAYFLDGGQLSADTTDFTVDGFRFSTGLGIRWLAFGMVPVVVDYGFVIGRRLGEPIGTPHFNVGYTF